VAGAPGESWRAVDQALRRGCRGLPGGGSLARMLRRARGVPLRPHKADPREAARLRASGLTLGEIGRRLGVTHQAVSNLLRRAEQEGKQT
jgi:DNA-binding CsgD family transcriptional regulator